MANDDDLRAFLMTRFDRVDDRFDRVDARFDGVNARLDALHARIDTLIDALSDLRSDFDRHTHG